MFNFDVDYVINNLATSDVIADAESLVIKRIGNYKKGTVKNVVLTPYEACQLGDIDLSGCTGSNGDLVRVSFKIACSGKYAEFAMANWGAFVKPVAVEFESDGSVKPLVAALRQVLDQEVAVVDDAAKVTLVEPIFSIVEESFRAVKVLDTCNTCSGYAEEEEEDLGVSPVITEAKEGAGTYEYILHNLRYPTRENLRYAAPNKDEMPIPGAEYDQLSFDVEVERQNPSGGLSAAGQVLVSRVHQVFFVNKASDVNATALKGNLEALA